jgi:chemotaxis protein MotB
MLTKRIFKMMMVFSIFMLINETGVAQETTTKTPKEEVKEPWFLYWKSEVTDAKRILEERNALEKKYNELQLKYNTDTQSLREENDRLKSYSRQLELEKQDRVSSRSVTTSDSESRIANLERELAETRRQKDSLERELAAKSSAERQAQERIKTLEAMISANESSKSSVSTAVTTNSIPYTYSSTTSTTTNSASNEDLKAQVNSLTNQRDQLQRDIAAIYGYQKTVVIGNQVNPTTTTANGNEAAEKANRLESELATMTKKRDMLQAQLDSMPKTSSTTTTTVTSVEEAKMKMTELENTNKALVMERDQLKIDLANSKKDKSLETKIAETKTIITTVETKQTEEEKAKELAAKNAAKEIAKIDEAKKETDAKIASNDKDLATKKMGLDELRKEIEILTKEISELKEDKETLETDLASTKEQHIEESSKSKEEIERLTLQAQKLEEALEKELKKNKGKSTTSKNGKNPKIIIGKESNTVTSSVTTEETDSSSEEGSPAKVSSKGGRTIISLASHVNFKSGSNVLTPKGKDTLNRVLKVLRKYASERIYIEGNTDNRPIAAGSKFRDNWHLSFERALTVLQFLNKDKSLAKTKFAAAAFAEKNPVKSNTTDPNRAANRRVDIVVVPKR